eukprot:UN25145
MTKKHYAFPSVSTNLVDWSVEKFDKNAVRLVNFSVETSFLQRVSGEPQTQK